MVELFVVSTVVLLGMTIIKPYYSKTVSSARHVQCVHQLRQLYNIGYLMAEDIRNQEGELSAEEADNSYRAWSSMMMNHASESDSIMYCPEKNEENTSIMIEDYMFQYTWDGGGDIPIRSGPRANIIETYSDPKGWRIGLEDGNDSDYNDLVVDVIQHEKYMEIKTISADMSGDIHFSSSDGDIIVSSLQNKLGETIRIDGGMISNYGINVHLNNINIGRLVDEHPSEKIFLLDYAKAIADPYKDNWNDYLSEGGQYQFERHPGNQVNVAFSDGSVRSQRGKQLNPDTVGNREIYWDLYDDGASDIVETQMTIEEIESTETVPES